MAKKKRRSGGTSQSTQITNLRKRMIDLEQKIANVGNAATGTNKRAKYGGKEQGPLNGMTRAICTETIDPWKENRIRFYHPLLHDPKTPVLGLPFAKPISAMGGFDDCGLNWVPPAGSTVALIFENGMRDAPFYMGTTWQRSRGPNGNMLGGVDGMREYKLVSDGHRKGYTNPSLNDEHQVLPQWNTESYNASDIDNFSEFSEDPTEQKRATYPNIYGFKTPEKHMLKMVDGNAKCNRRWKRLEIQSGCGNFMIFKDDHIHYGGQWGHPNCPPEPGFPPDVGEAPCSDHEDELPYFTNFHGKPIEGPLLCKKPLGPIDNRCNKPKGESCDFIIAGHPATPFNPPPNPTKYPNAQAGANKHFKHLNECRPIRGPGTPQNNKLDLPQTGIQFLSISGHTFVMDDSVEEPRGIPEWERSLELFDYGCNDKYLGLLYIKSSTGHAFEMSDVESDTGIRSDQNWIRLRSANGNKIELNDHTFGPPVPPDKCIGGGPLACEDICPPRAAGPNRGIKMQSTSNHVINMIDHLNEQCSKCRCEVSTPINKATRAYIQIRSGYGHEMVFRDDFSQQTTQQQYIQIMNPQCASGQDANCNVERGPHFLHMRAQPQGSPGLVLLRAGGHHIRSTYDSDFVFVGDPLNPSDKFTWVSRKHIDVVEDTHFRYTGELHIFFAEKQILLMAGRDCHSDSCRGPCLYPVVIGRCPVACPLTGIIHWTEKALSERVFASGGHPCQANCLGASPEGCAEFEEGFEAASTEGCAPEPTDPMENVQVGLLRPPLFFGAGLQSGGN